jgi:alcohol dehydrogenase
VWEQHGKVIFEGANTHSDLFAEEAIRRISGSLGDVLKMPSDLCARTAMLYGSLCAGLAFAQAGTAGAHALQYPVGALTKTAHGIGVGLLAPHVFAYTRSSAVEAFAAVGAALGVGDSDQTIASLRAVAELYRLITAAGIPPSLQAIGLPETALDQTAAEAALIKRLTRNSPRALDRAALRAILESALHGNPEQLDVELGPFLDQPEAPFGVSASAAPPSTGTVG